MDISLPIKFSFASVALNLAGYLSYLGLTLFLGTEPKVTAALIYISQTLIAFKVYKRLIFKHSKNLQRTFIKYLLVVTTGLLLVYFSLFLFHDLLKIPHPIVQLLSFFSIGLFLYIAYKRFVFFD